MISRWLLFACTLALTTSCASSTKCHTPDAENFGFSSLEARLLESRWIHFGFEITARGSLHAHVTGDFWLGQDGESRLHYEGQFQGKPVKATISSNRQTIIHSNKRWPAKAAPLDLRRAYILGFTRMGLLHNIAVSLGHGAPDHGMGDIDKWLKVVNPSPGRTENETKFEVEVGGEHAATAWLTLAKESNFLPRHRQQEVYFSPTSVMEVTEVYHDFRLNVAPPEGLFLVEIPSH